MATKKTTDAEQLRAVAEVLGLVSVKNLALRVRQRIERAAVEPRGARQTERIIALEREVANLTRARDGALARVAELQQRAENAHVSSFDFSRRWAESIEERDAALSLLREALDRYDRTPEGEWARAARAALQPKAQRERLSEDEVQDEVQAAVHNGVSVVQGPIIFATKAERQRTRKPHAAPPSHPHE